MVFLTIGILKSCRLTNLSRFTGWIKPQELCIYVDRLIKLSLLREQRHQYVRTQTDNILERTVAIQSGRGEETFCLMMESDRTDVGFCWLETGISPLRGNHLNEVALDTLGALARLIALFRPRPGLPGMLINFRTTAEGVTDGGNACDPINALLPKHLHSWMDKGAPWLQVLLYDLTAQYESSLVNANSWVELSPDIMIRPSFLRSVDSDLRRITKRGCFPGTIFNFGHELNTKEHVDACYESVMRRVLDAFPHRLVLIKSVDTANGANISATCIRGFECSTGTVHMIEDNAANTLLLRNLRHVSDKKFAPTFVIYFKLTLLGDNSTIDDLLVVPDTVVMDQLQTPHWN
ncbi:hypothetical protein NUW58_g5950 [Xylaria curta]|uniref:Uncharacterized protein n=1 Tax=Xylaria curta TaxID=42375 RepID=A0ACC1P1T1_9PEZI|nr:hypothetical protein NUW58_g5950 [Xylaria curta]